MAKLCQWCKQINFAAILTPREDNLTTDTFEPIYRKEYAGKDFCPTVKFKKYGKTVRTGPSESYLPQIRTAHYDDLVSNSARSESSLGQISGGVESEDSEGDRSVDGDPQIHGEDRPEWLNSGGEGTEYDGSEDSESGDEGSAAKGSASKGSVDEGSKDERIFEEHHDQLLASSNNKPEEAHHSDEILQQTESNHGASESLDDASSEKSYKRKAPRRKISEGSSKQQPVIKDRVARFGVPIHSSKDNPDQEDPPSNPDDFSDSVTSASTWSYASHFTELERIDLEKQAEGKWLYKRKQLYYLGTIWDVYSRRHLCNLCSYFWRRMRLDIAVKRAYITKSRCVLKCVEFKCKSLENPEDKEISMLNMLAIYCFKLGDPDERTWNVRVPFVLQGRHRSSEVPPLSPCAGPPPFRDDLFGEARLREAICDTSLFCQWLSFCETNHGHPKIQTTGEINFRLFDVYDSCLIEWKGLAKDLPRYFVLSYIWGKSQQRLRLTRANYSRLHRKGAIAGMHVNNTIGDTIELVQKMGQRYLWIDALCIIQDDDQDKLAQIPQMHLIYGLATLTIVAAFGEDADAGLPGIQPGSRDKSKILLQLDDISLLCRSNTKVYNTHEDIGFVENYLWDSKYSSRGWTFQEALLSTRALIFTRKQVFWECLTCTWCEETHWESKTIAYLAQRGVIDPTPQDIWVDNFDRRAYGGPGETTGEFQRNSYPNLVKAYSQRQLTDEGDILNAFSGVLRSVEAREKSSFLYALRERHFGNDLLWGWDTPSLPRTSTELWPSWSWLSWKGVIDIPNEPRHNSYDPTENIEPSDGVRCYILDLVGDEKKLRVVNKNGGWRFHEGYAKRGGGIFDPTWFHRPRGENSNSEIKSTSKKGTEERSQDITLGDLQALACFHNIRPNFHIFFYTWSSPVVLRTNGRHRGLYIDNGLGEEVYYGYIMTGMGFNQQSDNIFTDLVPDGRYEALHMNNNQSAQFGHMLIRWSDGIARRICMAVGPLEVWDEKYCASWKLIVLG
jgi:hypothetical protein